MKIRLLLSEFAVFLSRYATFFMDMQFFSEEGREHGRGGGKDWRKKVHIRLEKLPIC